MKSIGKVVMRLLASRWGVGGGVFALVMLATSWFYVQRGVVLRMRIAAERPFALQVYYQTAARQDYAEARSVTCPVSPGEWDKEVVIPANRVKALKLGFGRAPGTVRILDCKIGGRRLPPWRRWTFGSDVQERIFKPTGRELLVRSELGDPFMLARLPDPVTGTWRVQFEKMTHPLFLAVLLAFLAAAGLPCGKHVEQIPAPEIPERISGKLSNMAFLCSLFVVHLHMTVQAPVKSGLWFFLMATNFGLIAVPFYFFASGYLLAGHVGEPGWWRRAFGKRIVTLGVPYVVWSLLWLAYVIVANQVARGDFSWGGLSSAVMGAPFMRVFGLDLLSHPLLPPLWYLRALLVLVAVSPLFIAAIRKYRNTLLVLALLGILISTHGDAEGTPYYFWGRVLSIRYLWFFVLGMSLRIHREDMLGGWLRNVSLAGMVISWCAMGYLQASNVGAGLMYAAKQFGILSSFVFIWQIVPAERWPRGVTALGFPVYLLHWFFIDSLFHFSMMTTFQEYWTRFSACVALSLLVGCLTRKFMPALSGALWGGR